MLTANLETKNLSLNLRDLMSYRPVVMTYALFCVEMLIMLKDFLHNSK